MTYKQKKMQYVIVFAVMMYTKFLLLINTVYMRNENSVNHLLTVAIAA